jgi:hypothetical protein
MQEFHEAWQISLSEIVGAHARIEFIQAEVNGVRAIFHCRFRAFPIACRREQFRNQSSGLDLDPAGLMKGGATHVGMSNVPQTGADTKNLPSFGELEERIIRTENF